MKELQLQGENESLTALATGKPTPNGRQTPKDEPKKKKDEKPKRECLCGEKHRSGIGNTSTKLFGLKPDILAQVQQKVRDGTPRLKTSWKTSRTRTRSRHRRLARRWGHRLRGHEKRSSD
jgi:hypothetical protein